MSKRSNYAKQFWRDNFALGALTEAIECLEKIEFAQNHGLTEILYKPLCSAFIIAYCRPFTANNDIGSIGHSIVPAELKDIHQGVWAARNFMIGHTDPHEKSDNGESINRLRFKLENGHIHPIPSRLIPAPSQIAKFKTLAETIHDIVGERAAKLCKEVEVSQLQDGAYVFDYTAPKGSQWKLL